MLNDGLEAAEEYSKVSNEAALTRNLGALILMMVRAKRSMIAVWKTMKRKM